MVTIKELINELKEYDTSLEIAFELEKIHPDGNTEYPDLSFTMPEEFTIAHNKLWITLQ